jgi:hypothetical protein
VSAHVASSFVGSPRSQSVDGDASSVSPRVVLAASPPPPPPHAHAYAQASTHAITQSSVGAHTAAFVGAWQALQRAVRVSEM